MSFISVLQVVQLNRLVAKIIAVRKCQYPATSDPTDLLHSISSRLTGWRGSAPKYTNSFCSSLAWAQLSPAGPHQGGRGHHEARGGRGRPQHGQVPQVPGARHAQTISCKTEFGSWNNQHYDDLDLDDLVVLVVKSVHKYLYLFDFIIDGVQFAKSLFF